MNRKAEIEARLEEIRTLLSSDAKKDITALTKEVAELRAERTEIEQRDQLLEDLGKAPEKKKDTVEDPEQRSDKQPGEQRQVLNTKAPTSAEVRAFTNYLETRADDIAGGSLKTDSGFVVIPETIVAEILKLKELEYNLDRFVTVKPVSTGSGKYPVVRQSQVAALPEVAELAANPELAVKPFFMLAFDVKTYRGYFLISKEAIEDSAINVLAELKGWMARTIAATRNAAILKTLLEGGPGEDGEATKFETMEATGIDGLKDIVNINMLPNYEHNVAIVSQSAFAALDKMKDSTGNYLLQADVKDTTAKRLLGARLEVLPDEMLADAGVGTHKIVMGNLKDGIVLFDRSKYQAQWTDYMHFGEALMVAVRQDCRILDNKSVIVVDFTAETPTP